MFINKKYIGFVACIVFGYLYLKVGLHDFMIDHSLLTRIIDTIIIIIAALAGLALWQLLLYDFLKTKGKK